MDPNEAHSNTSSRQYIKHSVNASDQTGELWQYMVQHSYRPVPELDELQQVSLLACSPRSPRLLSPFLPLPWQL